MDAGRHPLIEVVTNAEVIGCEGEPGSFQVKVKQHPRYVREDLCVACGLCVEACPQVVGNEFDLALKARKAIYRPFPQSEPAAYIIDRENCLNDREQNCLNGTTFTYNSPDKHGTAPVTYGGYSESIVVDERFVLKVPGNLDLAGVAPLLCAGR